MLVELAVASAMVLFTVSIHALGLAALQRVTHRLLAGGRGGGWRVHAPAVVLVVLGLFTLHGL